MNVATIRAACVTVLITVGLLAGTASNQVRAQEMPSFQNGQMPELVELSESDVKRFLTTATDLEALGVEMDDENLDSLDAMMGQEKALDILRDNDFEPDSFMQVAFSIGVAYSYIGQSAAERAEMEAGIAQMEQMKASIPPEQWEAMKESMGAALDLIEQIKNQPENNLRLAEKYKADLERLMGD